VSEPADDQGHQLLDGGTKEVINITIIIGCPVRWSMPHPWKHSRSGWMGLGAGDPIEDAPGHCRVVGTRWPLKVSSNPNHAMIL